MVSHWVYAWFSCVSFSHKLDVSKGPPGIPSEAKASQWGSSERLNPNESGAVLFSPLAQDTGCSLGAEGAKSLEGSDKAARDIRKPKSGGEEA